MAEDVSNTHAGGTDIGTALWNLCRGVTHPHGEDYDLALERARAALVAPGRDPDDWSALASGRGR